MSKQLNTKQQQSLIKQEVLMAIASTLKENGPMGSEEVSKAIHNISRAAASRYLEELFKAGHVRKKRLHRDNKSVVNYYFQTDFSSKGDILSRALSNPLHHCILLTARKPHHES